MSDVDLRDPGSLTTWTQDIIRYSDLDPNGHVNNGAINAYFEDGRVRFREARLGDVAPGLLTGFVLVRYAVEYHAPLHFPGTVDIGTAVIRIGRSSYTLGQGVFHDGRCIATAEVVTVRVDPATGRPVSIDAPMRAALERTLSPA